MCGRYTLRRPERIPTPREILEQIDERRESLLAPRYNIAPSQRVLIADRDAEGAWTARPAT